MAHVEEAGGVVGDGELLDARHVVRILDGDGGVVGEDVQEGDGVIVELAGVRIEDLDDAMGAFASAQGQGDHGANFAQAGRWGAGRGDRRGLGNDERLAMLRPPSRQRLRRP